MHTLTESNNQLRKNQSKMVVYTHTLTQCHRMRGKVLSEKKIVQTAKHLL